MERLYDATSEQIQSWHHYTRNPTHLNHQIIILETTLIAPDLTALDQAIEYLVIRHESLRTYFVKGEDDLKQCVVPFDPKLFLPVCYDFCGLSSPDVRMQEVRDEIKRRLSDLSTAPLMCCAIFKLSKVEYQVCFMVHHIISDEWSKVILHKELGTIYELFRRGEKVDFPPLEMQLKDYAAWQRKWFKENGAAARSYWSQKLSSHTGIDAAKLRQHYDPLLSRSFGVNYDKTAYSNVDAVKGMLNAGKAAVCNSYICGEEYAALNEYCRLGRVSIGAMLNASFQLLFHTLTGKQKILLAMPVVNRFMEGTLSIIGGLGGGVYLLQPIHPDMLVSNFIREVYLEFLKSAGTLIFDHEEMELSGETLRLLTDLYVNFMNKSVTSNEKIKVLSGAEHLMLNDPEYYGISCIITEYQDGLLLQWKYNVALYTVAFVDELIQKHLLQLRLITLHPDIIISDLY